MLQIKDHRMHGSYMKQLVKSKSGLKIIPIDENEVSPFFMKEPIWVPDKQVSCCTKCNIKFGLTTRKHHCRRCGEIYCNSCSESKQALPRMCFVDPVRVCIDCLPQTKRETKFFDFHLKTLLQGASFNFAYLPSTPDQEKMLHCRLSQDHRSLTFNGTDLGPLFLHQITDLKMFKDISSGNKSLDIVYRSSNNDDDKRMLRLDTLCDVRHKERADLWLSAFHMGYSLLKDADP